MGLFDSIAAKARMAGKSTALIPSLAPKGIGIIRDKLASAVDELDKLEAQDMEMAGRIAAIPARVTLGAVASAASSAANQLRNVDLVKEIRGGLSDEDWAETQERLGIDVEEIAEMVGSGMPGDPRSCISHNALVGVVLKWTSLRNFMKNALEAAAEIEQGFESMGEEPDEDGYFDPAASDEDNGDHTPPTFGSYFS